MSTQLPEQSFQCSRCGTEYGEGDACPACGALRVTVPCDDDPARTAHSRCVICGRAVCDGPADQAQPALCADHRHVPVIEGWSQVYSTTSEIEAQLIAENLRAEGIDAQVYDQSDRTFPVDLGELSIVRVLVPVWEHGGALQLIEAYKDTEGEVTFACPACGEVYEPGAAACTACGAPLAAA
ncbi:MAG TPA: hypothetical protein VFX98_07175 [Longimicrobiaceae bacterium]|nr:hypothetical protein [Longimicrobiaceae bacterium]